MWVLIAGIALAAAAWLAPAALEARSRDVPPPEAVVRACSLGRTYAGADIAWLRTVQLLGDEALERQRWPHLEHWVDLTTALDPTFETPYYFGSVLLVGDAARAQVADRLLQRGQAALPDRYSLPALRGYIAYFSRLDPVTAAVHYRAAALLPGAPHFFETFANRLERQGHTCAEMLRNLNALAAVESAEKRQALLAGRETIVLGCVGGQLKNAASAFRLRTGSDGSLDELRRAGLVTEEPFAPPGRCWEISEGRPALVACTAVEPAP